MTDLAEVLEQIAERGTRRGAGAVLEAARHDAETRGRTRRHRGLITAGVLVVATLGTAAGVVALRSDSDDQHLVTTPGPTTQAQSGSLADPTITCTFDHDDAHASATIDPTAAPTSVTTRLGDRYQATVSVTPSGGHALLRVELFRGVAAANSGGDPSALAPIGTFETYADPDHAVGVSGNGTDGVQIACGDARTRFLEAVGDAVHGQLELAVQQLAIGGSVQTPQGWTRTTDVPGGSSVTTTFTDPADPSSRYVVSTNGVLAAWYEADGVPGSITPLVPADAKATLVQFGAHSWRYERAAPDATHVTVGAWIALIDPTSKKPYSYMVGEITVPKTQSTLADSVLFAFMFDYARN
jgi:hypothetical protein